MGNFSSSNTIKISNNDKTLIDMKTRCRELKLFNRNLDEKISIQIKKIKELVEKDQKKQALLALKYKKTLECAREKSEGSLNNLQELIDNVELAQLEVEIFKSLEKGSDALKLIQHEMPIEKVEKLMDEVSEGIANQKEISDILGNQIADLDDEELLQELAELESTVNQELSLNLPEVPTSDEVSKVQITPSKKENVFPAVPTSDISESSKKIEEKNLEPMLAN